MDKLGFIPNPEQYAPAGDEVILTIRLTHWNFSGLLRRQRRRASGKHITQQPGLLQYAGMGVF